MKIYDVKHCRACATSAMRDAKNGMDIIKQIEKKDWCAYRYYRRTGRG